MATTLDQWVRTIESAEVGGAFFAPHGNVIVPSLPPDQVQINTTSQAGQATLKEASEFFTTCRRYFEQGSLWSDVGKGLLDFGCGWGRISRFFLFDIKPEKLLGIDVEPEMIVHCKNTFHGQGHFSVCDAFPPTQIEGGSLAFIVGFSVFSHLSEAACQAWLEHFHQLLRPGGMIVLSTRGRQFMGYCQWLGSTNPKDGYSVALSNLFDDFAEAQRRYDAGEFIHQTSASLSGGGAMNQTFYGETFIPEQYAREKYTELFEFVDFAPDNGVERSVPYLVFRKRA